MSDHEDELDWAEQYAVQFPPYPPFADPEDWRPAVSKSAPSDTMMAKARQLAEDVTDDHDFKHEAHDHPWCRKCVHRRSVLERAAAGVDPIVFPREASAKLKQSSTEVVSQEQQERIQAAYVDELLDVESGDGVKFGISDESLRAWVEYLNEMLSWQEHWQRNHEEVVSRILRYLLLYGRAPVDTFDATSLAELEELYLSREQLKLLPKPEPLIAGVLPRHSYGIIRGRDQSFKSFVALDWGACLATGKPWQGHASERVNVLYVAGEGAFGLDPRLDAWEAAWGRQITPESFTIRRLALNLHTPGAAFQHLLQHVHERRYGLVILDTLRRVAGRADGNGSEMGAVIDNIDQIKQATAGGSVLVIAHTDKTDSDTRGYSGIEDDADFVWHAKRDEMSLTLENTKMKDGPECATHHLVATASLSSLVLGEGSAVLAGNHDKQVKILDALRYVYREGAYSGALCEATGMAKATYQRALNDLKDAGQVVNTGTGQRPFYVLAENAWSHDVSTGHTPSDLHVSHESHGVSTTQPEVSRVSPPFRGETETGPTQETA